MIQMILGVLGKFLLVLKVSHAIAPYTPNLRSEERFTYAAHMVDAGERTAIDPLLIAAVMWHESMFQNLPRNATNDYGLMQVHWQPREPWLAGVTRVDLMDPQINILAGARELAFMRGFCRRRDGRSPDHGWWSHYKYGVVVLGARYGQTILWRYGVLRSRESQSRAPS